MVLQSFGLLKIDVINCFSSYRDFFNMQSSFLPKSFDILQSIFALKCAVLKFIQGTFQLFCTAICINILINVISAVGKNISSESTFSTSAMAEYLVLNCSSLFSPNFTVYTHLSPITFLYLAMEVSSYVSFFFKSINLTTHCFFPIQFLSIYSSFFISFGYISSSSSSCRATSMDIPDPLSPLLLIVHRLW